MEELNYSFLSAKQVTQWLGVSKTVLRKLRQEPDFPSPVRIAGSARWRSDELSAWAESRRRIQPGEMTPACARSTASRSSAQPPSS